MPASIQMPLRSVAFVLACSVTCFDACLARRAACRAWVSMTSDILLATSLVVTRDYLNPRGLDIAMVAIKGRVRRGVTAKVAHKKSAGVTIGVDFGGTKIAAGIVANGKVHNRVEVPTGAVLGREHVIGQLRSAISLAARGNVISHVGIGVPGLFSGTRVVLIANIRAMDGVDLHNALSPVIGKATLALENDARSFALAETRVGAGKGLRHVVGITLGTGVGTGIIIDGRVYRGSTGSAGEMGHAIVDCDARSFRIGDGGDWESVISGRAMQRYYQECCQMSSIQNSSSQKSSRGVSSKKDATKDAIIDAPRVSDFWNERSAPALATRDFISRKVAIFVANILSTLDPEMVVIGGGAASEDLVRRVNALLPRYGSRPIARFARLGKDAGIIGAALAIDET